MKRLNPNTIVADFRLAATLMAYKKRGGDEGGGTGGCPGTGGYA